MIYKQKNLNIVDNIKKSILIFIITIFYIFFKNIFKLILTYFKSLMILI